MSTRLYHRICDAQGLCYDVSAGYDGYEDDGIIDFAAGVIHDRTARVTSEILHLMSELAEDGPTADELEKAKRRIGWETNSLRDSAEDAAAWFAHGRIFGKGEAPEARLERLLAVTKDDVVRVARTIARPDRLNVVAVGMLDDGEDERLTDAVRSWRP
jgi:predicted Zn-dependent peptidase